MRKRLKCGIEDVGLPASAEDSLRRLGCITVADVVALSKEYRLVDYVKGFGAVSEYRLSRWIAGGAK